MSDLKERAAEAVALRDDGRLEEAQRVEHRLLLDVVRDIASIHYDVRRPLHDATYLAWRTVQELNL